MSPRKLVIQSAYQYDVTSRISDFQNREQSINLPKTQGLHLSSSMFNVIFVAVNKTKVRFFALKNLMSKHAYCGALSLEVHM